MQTIFLNSGRWHIVEWHSKQIHLLITFENNLDPDQARCLVVFELGPKLFCILDASQKSNSFEVAFNL